MRKSLTQEKAIVNCKSIRGDRYNYSKSIYKDYHSHIEIICKEHGEFFQRYSDHLRGNNCPICCNISRSIKHTPTLQTVINKANIMHNNKYDYSLITEYIHSEIDYTIICPHHGAYIQKMSTHLQNHGCPICGGSKPSNTKEFISRAIEIHGDTYSYSKVNYLGNRSKVIITCKEHGDFQQTPGSHLNNKSGCPHCKQSHGEKIIVKILTEHNIEFKTQKSFSDCKHKKTLRFDFYIPYKNTLIEYDGSQHFFASDQFGGEKELKQVELRDDIKNKYCDDNVIPLIRLPYWLPYEDIKDILINDLQIY